MEASIYMHNTDILSFNGNREDRAWNVPADQSFIAGSELIISETVPYCQKYTFLGWSENAEAIEPTYLPGGVFVGNSSTTLYAVWCEATELGTEA